MGNPYTDTLVGGWALKRIGTLHSGPPFDVGASNAIPNICPCANTEHASLNGNPGAIESKEVKTTWFNTAAFSVSAPYTFGTLARNSLRSEVWRNTVLSLVRYFNLGLDEARLVEFPAEGFTIFNCGILRCQTRRSKG